MPLPARSPVIAVLPVIVLTLAGCNVNSGTTTRIQWQSGLESRTVETRGSVEFTDDDRDVKSLSPGGSVFVEDGSWLRTKRSYLVKADDNGVLSRTYKVGGRAVAMDADAQAWRAGSILALIRETGADASLRVGRLLRNGGPPAVLREVSEIRSDGSKRIYLRELVNRGELTGEQLRDVMRSARKIGSDGDKTELLIEVAPIYLKSNLQESWFTTLSGVGSDGDRRRALEYIIRRDSGSETMALTARMAGDIGSDGDKAAVLSAIGVRGFNDVIRPLWMRSVQTIGSDGDKARVLSTVLSSAGDHHPDTRAEILRAAKTIGSDGDKSNVLVDATRMNLESEGEQRAFFAATNSIGSDGDRKKVLTALLRKSNLAGPVLTYVAQSAKKIGSDADKASVLERVAEFEMNGLEERTAFFTAVKSIGSEHDRAAVLDKVLRNAAARPETVVAAIDGAIAIGSDRDKASLLIIAAERHASNPTVRATLEEAVDSMHPDGEYRRLRAALRKY